MRVVNSLALVLVVLIAALSVLIFVLENQREVVLSFLGWTTVQLPISIWMVFSLILGMFIGPVLTMLFKRRSVSNQLTAGR